MKSENITIDIFPLPVLMLKEKSLVIYWHSKDSDANAIHRKLVTHFGDDPPRYSTVMKWLRRLVCGDDVLETVERKGKESDVLVDFKILLSLPAFPFHSVRTFASSLKIPRSTISIISREETSLSNI
jgi:hypothetical protein